LAANKSIKLLINEGLTMNNRFFLVAALALHCFCAQAQVPVGGAWMSPGEIQRAVALGPVMQSVAALYPDYPTILFSDVETVPYAKERSADGVLIMSSEWHGTVVLRSAEKACLKIIRNDFKLVKYAGIELPRYSGTVTSVACPELGK
jgi:hypothetical protein